MRGAHRTLDTHRSPRCSCKYCSQHAYPSHDGEATGSSSGTNLKNREKKQSVISRGLRRVRAGMLARIESGGEDVDEIMDDGGAEEGEAEEEAEEAEAEAEAEEAEAAADPEPDPDAVEAEATGKNGVGVDTNVVNTEPTNAISAIDHGGNV